MSSDLFYRRYCDDVTASDGEAREKVTTWQYSLAFVFGFNPRITHEDNK